MFTKNDKFFYIFYYSRAKGIVAAADQWEAVPSERKATAQV
jgi:hypothetical protein